MSTQIDLEVMMDLEDNPVGLVQSCLRGNVEEPPSDQSCNEACVEPTQIGPGSRVTG